MSNKQLRADLQTALQNLATGDLRTSATALLGKLGYASHKTLDLPTEPQAFTKEVEALLGGSKQLNPAHASLADWQSAAFLFQLTNDELPALAAGQMSLLLETGGVHAWQVESFVFLALDLKPGTWSRTRLAALTREVNRLFPMPAIVLFRHPRNDSQEGGTPLLFELLAGFVDLASNRSILELWLTVQRALPSRNLPKYVTASFTACQQFNDAARRALALLLPEARAILKRLCPDGLELTALPFDGVRYNGGKQAHEKAYVGKNVELEIAYRGLPIERPQHYLNEARQSAIGLALYLGARLACAPQTTPHLKLLVLDDVLMGLDHSNRLPVLNVLVDLFADWQVVLLTHDKGWFDLARQRLPTSDWFCYEVYEGDPVATAPMPVVRKTQNRPALALLQKARDLLTQGYMEAAANYVRQVFEAGIRAACEFKSIKQPYKQDVTDHKTQELLNGLKGWPGNAAVPKADWDAALSRLELMKDVVMNPYSHPSAPNIPRQEIVDATNAVDKFLELTRKK
nr:hypothetical protein [Rhodoferax sp.]